MKISCLTICMIIFIRVVGFSQTVDKDILKQQQDIDHLMRELRYQHAIPILKFLLSSDTANASYLNKLGICYLNTPLMKAKSISCFERAVELYRQSNPLHPELPINFYYLMKSYRINDRFLDAIETFGEYSDELNNAPEVLDMIIKEFEMASYGNQLAQDPIEMVFKNLGSHVNTEFVEHSPVISADESVMIFTSRRPESVGGDAVSDAEFYEDLYIAYNNDGVWTKPQNMGLNINTADHEASIGLSSDGQKLFIYKNDNGDGNIYMSELNGDVWSKPKKMGDNINSKARETHACLSADENMLFFTSDRKDGYGGLDIYWAKKLPNGKWALPQNLGPIINTPEDEESPYIHPDGVTLYFSTKGHKSIGGYDIFYSILDENGNWSKPENLGYPINTTDDDVFYVLTTNGQRAYYASLKADGFGQTDIYTAELPELEEKKLCIVKGVIVAENGKELPDIRISVSERSSKKNAGVYHPNTKTGKYLFILNRGKRYKVEYIMDGSVFHQKNLYFPADTTEQILLDTITATFTGMSLDGITYDEVISIKPILCDLGDIEKFASHDELDKLSDYLNRNKEAIIEIGAYADASGSNNSNLRLTKKRANAIKDYLTNKGVSKKQLIATGYGEQNPVAIDKNPDGSWNYDAMKYNRRIEFKVVKQGASTLLIDSQVYVPQEYRIKTASQMSGN